VAARYGELRTATGRQPANDPWIAATALAHDFTLITADERLAFLPLAPPWSAKAECFGRRFRPA